MKIRFRKVDKKIPNELPSYQTKHSAGMDLTSSSFEDIVIPPTETRLVPTNLIIEIPTGYEGQVRPRSGLALKYNVTVLNSPGTIDSDYRGEIKVLLINHGKGNFTVKFGDRIAQLVISPYMKAKLKYKDKLSKTERGRGGYGSTGINSKKIKKDFDIL